MFDVVTLAGPTAGEAARGTLTAVALLAALIWLTSYALALRHRRRNLFLADLPAGPPPGGWPALAVVFAARNEAAQIERAARSMLSLSYPGVAIVAVNDRSTDATPALLSRLAAEDGRLQVVDIATLPPGWLGKNHALHAATRALTADWLLLTDADIVFSPEALKKAVAFAVEGAYDLVSVFPGISYDSPLERLFVAYFGVLLGMKLPNWGIEDPKSRLHIGIGAFNLVRRTAFEHIGGFARLRLSVDDDIRLGEALKAHGFRLKLLQGRGELSLKWQDDILAYIRGLEKNAFAGLDYSLGWTAFVLVTLLITGLGPVLALALGGPLVKLLGVASFAAVAGLLGQARRGVDIHPLYALATPLAMGFMTAALVRSTVKTLRVHGVVWRDHRYDLAELKAHVHARRAWVNEAWLATRARGYGPPPDLGAGGRERRDGGGP